MPVVRVILIKSMGFIFLMMLAGAAVAAETCQTTVGHLVTAEGQVDVQRSGSSGWREGLLGGVLCQGDTVRAGASSRATIRLINQAVLRIDQNTAMRLDNISGVSEESSSLSLLKGAFQSFSRKPRGFEVSTPYLNGSIEGTEFVFRVKENSSELTVLQGLVLASNEYGSVEVGGGESALSRKGKAPSKRTVVKPRDAVQWSLYYPPLTTSSTQASGKSSSLQQAASLLSVGRVDEAQAKIDTALKRNPNAGEGYALRAVINVAQNNSDQAMADARQAVALSPESSSAKIALSYAQQSIFDLQGARDTLQQAVQQQPNDALAWARLAELQLMLGDRKQSGVSAQKAVSLQPDLGRTQMTLGFAALAEFRNDEARAAFERAIEYDSADPLAHLGLGLARISSGNLEAGRAEIEVAVGLGSNDALLRAYLGKAYFEEKRSPLDTDQFAIAKQLDPNDPTAYLYNGIAKQAENRPIEAVWDFRKSIELNDNRAVYRSRLLLDEDRAARGTSLARAYNDLGFKQLGVNQARDSLVGDPSNSAAHRFLSDSYNGLRRHEISRVSELLQAQMLQDTNINPVQPSLSATNLNIFTLGGPASAGFNEFTPLFERNKTQFNVTGFGGDNDTYGGEAVVSGLYGPASFSAGAYSYDTDGWRPNNDLSRNIYNLFGQVAITPELNLQAEFRRNESKAGDLEFNFDPDDYSLNKTDERDRDTVRLGLRYTPISDGRHNFLLSYIHNDLDQSLSQSESLDPFTTLSFDSDIDDTGDQYEGQYIYRNDQWNIVSGLAYSDSDRDIEDSIVISIDGIGPVDSFGGAIHQRVEHSRGYSYATGDIPLGDSFVDWTIGASYDDYKEGILKETSFNPKFGVLWQASKDLRLRAAAFKVVKPLLVNNRTLEPTQVAGFNQFFDDVNGTKSWRYGAGVDWSVNSNLSVGAEATWRDLDEPVFKFNEDMSQTTVYEDRDEQLHRLYLYWTPTERIGVSSEVVYDLFESQVGEATEFGNLPTKVKTIRLPVGINYFHPSGFFAGALASYVDQEVVRSEFSTKGQGKDNFFLVDVAVGYRFSKRRGIASLSITNLFDQEFYYQDDNFREFRGESSTGPYFPERIVRASVSLNF